MVSNNNNKGKEPLEDETQDPKLKEEVKSKDESVLKEVKGMPSTKGEQPAVRKPTFAGSVNAQRAFSHNVQGITPPIPD